MTIDEREGRVLIGSIFRHRFGKSHDVIKKRIAPDAQLSVSRVYEIARGGPFIAKHIPGICELLPEMDTKCFNPGGRFPRVTARGMKMLRAYCRINSVDTSFTEERAAHRQPNGTLRHRKTVLEHARKAAKKAAPQLGTVQEEVIPTRWALNLQVLSDVIAILKDTETTQRILRVSDFLSGSNITIQEVLRTLA